MLTFNGRVYIKMCVVGFNIEARAIKMGDEQEEFY
jgi:hypothetical protein